MKKLPKKCINIPSGAKILVIQLKIADFSHMAFMQLYIVISVCVCVAAIKPSEWHNGLGGLAHFLARALALTALSCGCKYVTVPHTHTYIFYMQTEPFMSGYLRALILVCN